MKRLIQLTDFVVEYVITSEMLFVMRTVTFSEKIEESECRTLMSLSYCINCYIVCSGQISFFISAF